MADCFKYPKRWSPTNMDGALVLAKDIATGVTIEKGHVKYPKENGCGVSFLG